MTGKAALSPAVIDTVIAKARAAHVPVYVDPKGEDFRHGAGIRPVLALNYQDYQVGIDGSSSEPRPRSLRDLRFAEQF